MANQDSSAESGASDSAYDSESLPSYTLVSGLPSYDDALDCYRKDQGSSGSARPSILKLFSFDNPLLGAHLKETAADLQQVVVVDDKDGLPSYQESLVVATVDEKRERSKRSTHKPKLPLVAKQVATVEDQSESSASSAAAPAEASSVAEKLGCLGLKTKKGGELPQTHKSPSLVYDDEYWMNVHQNRPVQEAPLTSEA